jgi:flavin reductase (DIM6/NTAB) family NADH-FMN oxidoreductase RutF/DNA-binding IclR family transcriptional regulator
MAPPVEERRTAPDTAGVDEGSVVDPGRFRQVLGQYPTGVVIVTALDGDGSPLGMTVGSFSSVSLDPPLVAFMPDKKSSSWKALRESGLRFCVNVLAAKQEEICRLIAMRKQDKFVGIDWSPSPSGLPVITGSVAWLECDTTQVVDAGDHEIVLGRVTGLDLGSQSFPLLFFRGGYGSFTPLSLATGDADLVDRLTLVDLARPHMETLAARFDTEVTAVCLVRNELVLTAAAGRSATAVAPTRVGQRLPWVPPVGSLFAAFGGQARIDTWLKGLDARTPPGRVEYYLGVPARIRAQGYSLALGHEKSATTERVATKINVGDPEVDEETLRAAISDMAEGYNPVSLAPDESYELHLLSAPVFGRDGSVAFQLNIWGPAQTVTGTQIEQYATALKDTARQASEAIRAFALHEPAR